MTPDLAFAGSLIDRFGRSGEATLPILQAVQTHYGYLPPEVLRDLSQRTGIPISRLAGVATFYPQFRHHPVGKHLVRVCDGTACHVKGSELVRDAVIRHLKIPAGADTDAEGLFTVEKVACLGCCTLAPVIQVDNVTYGHLTPDHVAGVLEDFLRKGAAGHRQAVAPTSAASTGRGELRIGLGSCCMAKGSEAVFEALKRGVAELGGGIAVKRVGCVGMCSQAPLLEVAEPSGRTAFYARVQADDVTAILRRHFKAVGAVRKLRQAASHALEGMLAGGTAADDVNVLDRTEPATAAFFDRQVHIATAETGHLDPTDIEQYLASGGFEALRKCLAERTPDAVIDEVKRSGLRGRGGGGFPTGTKWAKVRQAVGDRKVVIVNGDEGDPGAFMDRMIMESYPYRVLEGLAIAAYAMGAKEGILYVRAEYPLAVERLREAIAVCERRGFLGDNMLGRGIALAVRVFEGAGAFVCGEETALLASLEGRRGMPRLRPPYPDEYGYQGRPTLVNNVETFALVPWIVRHGAAAFAALGAGESRGTKVFALAGKVRRGGLIEVPMGITIREIVNDIGGGMMPDRTFKAIQIGGPSGGCIPASLAETPVDYHSLSLLGAIMGSGGIVVLDDTDCMVELARYFLEFTQGQSCGRCTFCRIGTRRMLDILDRVCTGKGRLEDLGSLEQLAHNVRNGSLCGLGKTAPNPVLTTLKYFRSEYEAHVNGKCPAGRCRALISYTITDKCIGCTLCAQHCPVDAIPLTPYRRHTIDLAKCVRCDTCRVICPEQAVKVE